MVPRIHYAPNTTAAARLMAAFAKAAACPADPTKKRATSDSFYRYFSSGEAPLVASLCMSSA